MSTAPSNPIRTPRPGPASPDQAAADHARSVLSPQQLEASTDNSLRERIVLSMMTLVTAAAAGMMHVQFGYPLAIALVGGFGVWGALLLLHTLIKRSGEVSRMRAEVARLELELARTRTLGSATAAKAAVASQPAMSVGTATDQGGRPPESLESKAQAIQARLDAQRNATAGDQAGDAMPYAHAPIAPDARWEQTNDMARSRLVPAQPAQPAADTAVTANVPAYMAGGGNDNARRRPGAAQPAPNAMAAPSGMTQQMPNPAMGTAPVQNQTVSQTAPGYATAPQQPRAQSPLRSDRDLAAPPGPFARRSPAQSDNDLVDVPAWSGTQASAKDPFQDAWALPTAEGNEPRAFAADAMSSGMAPRTTGARTVEGDLELVQRKIKALADEVNAGEAFKAQMAAEAPSGPMEESITALRTTAERMRQPRAPSPAAPPGARTQNTMPAHDHAPAPAHYAPPAQPAARPEPPQQPGSAAPQSGVLPSLDALIPATAEPIAVSQPAAPQPPRAPQPAPQAAAEHLPAPARQTAPSAMEARTPQQSPAPKPAPQAQARATSQERRIAEIAAAIETSRMDVFLNPIVGLGDYAVSHFEISVRLKSAAGDYIDSPERTLSLGATDLLALFDIERLNRTAQVAEQLEARGKSGALLSPTAGPSMTDGKFLEAFARAFETRTSISGQLVLTFTQADIAAFGAGTWQALADMNSFGFRFALDHVTHFTTDFADLAERGFAFVKLPASAFLEGLPAGKGMVSPADICRSLAGEGLTLVVEAVDDEALLARVFGFGALYGQGALFGGARQITLEAPGPRTQAA